MYFTFFLFFQLFPYRYGETQVSLYNSYKCEETTPLQAATMAKEVKLFGTWASPYTSRVEVVLKLKGIEYENVVGIMAHSLLEWWLYY